MGGAGSGGGGSAAASGKTCKDLEACCNMLSGSIKDACTMAYSQIKSSGDSACGAVYESFTALGCK
jgi:hypothetical protein